MTWQSTTFEELKVGDVLVSAGGHRWTVIARTDTVVTVKDHENGVETPFEKRREYWRCAVERE